MWCLLEVVGSADVPDCSAVQCRLLRQGRGFGQAERFDDPLAQNRVPTLTSENLDDSSGDHEAGVAVRPIGAGGEELHR